MVPASNPWEGLALSQSLHYPPHQHNLQYAVVDNNNHVHFSKFCAKSIRTTRFSHKQAWWGPIWWGWFSKVIDKHVLNLLFHALLFLHWYTIQTLFYRPRITTICIMSNLLLSVYFPIPTTWHVSPVLWASCWYCLITWFLPPWRFYVLINCRKSSVFHICESHYWVFTTYCAHTCHREVLCKLPQLETDKNVHQNQDLNLALFVFY